MSSLHNFLVVCALSLLVSCVLARSIPDDVMTLKEAELLREGAGPFTDTPALAQLLDYLLAYQRHMIADDQSAYRLDGVKRSWSEEAGFVVPSSMKRKMFWTPLGQLPASARLGRPQALRPNLEDSGSPVFRYG